MTLSAVGPFKEGFADVNIKFTNKAEFTVVDYWRLKIPCLKTTWNINYANPYMVLPLFATRFADYAGGHPIGRTSRQPNYPNQLAPKRGSERSFEIGPQSHLVSL